MSSRIKTFGARYRVRLEAWFEYAGNYALGQ